MQKKINIVLYSFIIIASIVLLVREINNRTSTRLYQTTLIIEEIKVEVKIYDKYKVANKIIKEINASKYQDNLFTAYERLEQVFIKYKVKSYLVSSNKLVMAGNYYKTGKYKMALPYKDNSIFKIIDIENEVVMINNIDNYNYNRYIIKTNTLDSALKLNTMIKSNMPSITNYKSSTIYLLKDKTLVDTLEYK